MESSELYSRIPRYKSQPLARSIGSGSVRSYDPRMLDGHSETDDDDFGFKSMPEYALARIFADHGPGADMVDSEPHLQSHRAVPRIIMTPGSPPGEARKKRKAPDPPQGLAATRNKFPSSDNIIDLERHLKDKHKRSGKTYGRPTSLSPNRRSDLLNELMEKIHSKSPSPNSSPRHNRSKNILEKLRSPRISRKPSKRTRTTSKDDEEAGFKSLSNQSSFDESVEFSEETVFFGLIPDLERDMEFEVQRIPEYDKYLNELLRETDPGHPDYDHLSRAAAKVRLMVKEREDELGNMDNQKRMERVQDKFPYDDLQLRDLDLQRRQLASRRKSAPGAVLFKTLGKSKSSNNLLSHNSMGKKELEMLRPMRQHNNFNRQYLMEGNVEFSRGMQTQDRYLFLFSDLLLVAKQKSNTTFKLKHRIRVSELWIAYCIDDITELTRPAEMSFVIGWPTTNVVATFKSVELKETWLNKLKEQIQEERDKLAPKTLPLEVQHKGSDKACQVEVEASTEVSAIVRTCVEQLSIPETEVKDYQLWVRMGPDESPYPLCGHELPYAIRLSHLRDYEKRNDDNLTEIEIQRIVNEMQNNNRKYEFFLKHKKSPKRQSLDENSAPSKGSKGKRKSPLINLFKKHREDKKPQGQLFGHPLASVTTPENLIAKPIKELLTILFREGPYTLGILRKSCNAKLMKDVKQRLDDGEDFLSNEQMPALVVGALVKDYLKNIPQSLLMEEFFNDWITANELKNDDEKKNKIKDILSKLPACHESLLRHLMCVLYHIDQKSEENKMTAYNLSVCIAPSLLWPKGNPDPLATPPAIIQYMIQNCAAIFGEEAIHLFGDLLEQKLRQDSSTDSDSMHSVLSNHSNFRRDDSSIDSLEREMLYSGEIDASPHIMKSHHFSPSNLSGDSGLTLSDSQLYDEDGNGNDISERRYSRSSSHCIHRDVQREDGDQASRSLDSQYYYAYDPQNPVPPPRRARKKGSEPNQSPEYERKAIRYTSVSNIQLPGRIDKRPHHNVHSDKYKHRRSSESLKSVEESSEADSEINMKGYRPKDYGTLIKSASGAHLYFEEINSPFEFSNDFDNINRGGRPRHLYKQTSDGAMPMSPQSKYSLSSSRDSVLSDSSGSYLNRQNSPDPLSSSAETPDNEDRAMSEWLSNQSKQTAFLNMKQRQFSHDDSEVGLKLAKKPPNKMEYLVSPKTSPKIKRRSPIPLANRRSFPLQVDISPKGSGSNTSKEAEDIIKSPKLSITYCSQDSLDKRGFESSTQEKCQTPHLDLYNNNSQTAMKQLNIYSAGLQGTSPPPRVVLQGFSQAQPQKRENTPVKGNHNILPQARRNSFDTAEFHEHKKYPMEETSVSSEGEDSESDSEVESFRVMTMINVPLKYDVSKKVVSEPPSTSKAEPEVSPHRPEQPPAYSEAVQRNFMLKQGLSPDTAVDEAESQRQREASLRARQLYEQSMRQYQEQRERSGYSLPSQKFEQTLSAVGEKQEALETSEEEGEESAESSGEEVDEPEFSPRRLYEESLKKYMEEQSSKPKSPLVKTASQDEDSSLSRPKGGDSVNRNVLNVSGLHRSHSDAHEIRSRINRSAGQRPVSRDNTPSKRPNQPPPYNNPPPYHSDRSESSPSSVDRHQFPKTGDYFYNPESNAQSEARSSPRMLTTDKVVSEVSPQRSSSGNAQSVSVPKRRDNILVSNRARNVNSVQERNSANQSEKSGSSESVAPRIIGRPSSDLSVSVFRPRASSLEQNNFRAKVPAPGNSAQGPIAHRNPIVSKSQVISVRSDRESRRNSLDAAVARTSLGISKELPWSVKSLSNIFDKNSGDENGKTHMVPSNSSTPTRASSSPSRPSVPPPYTPPPPFQHRNDVTRSSTSSSSSISSAGGRVPSNKSYNKFGPQARDSFSSTDDSDCSCRYSLNCRRDNSLEELEAPNFTDITYV